MAQREEDSSSAPSEQPVQVAVAAAPVEDERGAALAEGAVIAGELSAGPDRVDRVVSSSASSDASRNTDAPGRDVPTKYDDMVCGGDKPTRKGVPEVRIARQLQFLVLCIHTWVCSAGGRVR